MITFCKKQETDTRVNLKNKNKSAKKMDTKRLKFLGFEKGTFLEKRLVYLDPPPEVAPIDEAAEHQENIDRAVQFIAALNKYGVAVEGADKPESILEDNPFADHIISFAQNFDDPENPDEILTFEVTEDTDGKIVLKYGDKEFPIEKELYVAIFWKKIKPQLDESFKGKNVSDDLIEEAAVNSVGFKNFLFYLATNPSPVDSKRVADALKDLDALKPGLAPAAVAARGATKKHVEAGAATVAAGAKDRDDLRDKENLPKPKVKLPVAPKWDKNRFIAKVKDPNLNVEFDRWKTNINRQKTKINVTDWTTNHIKLEGLEGIYQNFRDLNIISQNPEFYQTMFAVLRNAADPDTNPYAEDRYRVMFENPAANRDELSLLAPTVYPPGHPKAGQEQFWGGEQFVHAFEQLKKIQTIILAQDKYQTTLAESQRKVKEDTLATGGVDFVKSNLATLQTAVREKDWATVGIYAVGFYAMYQTYKRLSSGPNGDKYKKWLTYGVAAYAGNIFAKNAGYDILKMLGIKDADAEVKGTPMEIMKNLLSAHPHLHETTKDIDYGIVLQMGDVDLKNLHKLYKESNKNDIQFIHPKELRNIFPDVAQAWPFKTGGGVNIKDYMGMNGKRLSTKEKEYVRVGQQIYKIAFAMQGIYNETLRKGAPDANSPDKRHSPYEGKTYEEAISDSTLGLSHLWHLLDAAEPYADTKPDDGMFGIRERQKVADMLMEVFGGISGEENVTVEEELGPGHYQGRIRNFPVVFVASKDGWKVYLKHQYGKGYNQKPSPAYVSIIPFTGPDREFRAKQAIDAVKKRMMDLVQPLVSVNGRDLLSRTLVYDGGSWKCKVQFAAAAEYEISATDQEATIQPNYDGNAVTLMDSATMGRAFKIHVDEEIAKQNPVDTVLIPKLVNQEEFHALRVLSYNGSLRTTDNIRGDSKFTLLIGKKGLKVDVKYDKSVAPAKFVFDPATQEAELLKSPAFAQEYTEAMSSNKDFELNKTAEDIKKLLENATDEKFVMFFLKSLIGQTYRGELQGFNTDVFSGTVPENFTSMLIDTAKYSAMTQFRRGLSSAASLKDVNQVMTNTVSDINIKLQSVYETISSENLANLSAGEEWERIAFMLKVTDKIRAASTRSTEYADQRSKLEADIYKMNLPGFAAGSDWNKVAHKSVEKLVNVYSYYTAHLDSHTYKFKNAAGLDDEQIIDLDHLATPPVATPGIADPTKDPALRAWYIMNYLHHVKTRIVNESQVMAKGGALKLQSIHDPSSRAWKIEEFEIWQRNNTWMPIDRMDAKEAFTHDLAEHRNGRYTKLDQEVHRRFKDAQKFLEEKLGNDLNTEALESYLFNRRQDTNGDGVVDELDMGLLSIYHDSTTNLPNSKIWEDNNDQIASSSGNRRKTQIHLIDRRIDRFYDFVFSKTGRSRFFKEDPGVWERVKRFYNNWKYGI